MKRLSVLLVCLLFLSTLSAKRVLEDLDFRSDNWVVIGIPLHNYQALPVQKEMGTFIIRDQELMKNIQKNWDLESTFEDKCDYHYALKFYRDNKLIRTIKLNLFCGYLTWDGLSYEFSPMQFEDFRSAATPIDWSRISFADLDLLKEAINTLDNKPNVYWYEDVYPYTFPGYFMLGVNGLPWDANLDSLDKSVDKHLSTTTQSEDYYLKRHFYFVRGDKLYARYLVNCSLEFSLNIPREDQYMPWRSHLQHTDSVRIVAIGIDHERYKRMMKEWRR